MYNFWETLLIFAFIFLIFLIFAVVFSFVRAITLKGQISKLTQEVKELREKFANLYVKSHIEVIEKSKHENTEDLKNSISPQQIQTNTQNSENNIFEIKEEILEAKKENIEVKEEAPKPKNMQTPQKIYTQKNESKKSNEFIKGIISWIIGGNIVAKIAILILFFGISFLLKYSIDKGILSPEIRILGSAILGFVFIALGFKLREKNELFALILQGGGIGVLYLTTFAAAKLYPIMIPVTFAFLILVALCAVSVVFALSQNAISLAIVAFLGAYLAPILLSDGSGNHKVLFVFYTLVSIGIVVISKWRSWRSLNLLGFVFTYIIFYYWMFRSYHDSFYIETQIFILANLIIYGFLAVVLFIRGEKKQKFTIFIDILMLFGTPLFSFLAQYKIIEHLEFGAAFSAVFYGLIYIIGTFVALKYYKDKTVQVLYYGLGLALSFATIAIPLALSDNLTSLVWMVEGSIISYIALKNKQIKVSFAGLLITAFGMFYALKSDAFYILNGFDFIVLFGFVSASTLFNACIFYHFRALGKYLFETSIVLICIASISWIAWIFGGVGKTLENDMLSVLTFFTIAVWIWYFIGKKQNFVALKYAIISLWPILLFAVWIDFNSFQRASIFWEMGWVVAFFSAYFYLYHEQNSTEIIKKLNPLLHISLFWIVCGFVYSKCSYLLNINLPWGYGVIKYSVLLSIFSLVVLFVYYLSKKSIFPFNNFKNEYWTFGLFPVIFYIVINLLNGASFSGNILGLRYITFVNPLEESAIFALMIVIFYFFVVHEMSKNSSNTKGIKLISYTVPSALVFIWANSILVRFLSHLLDVRWAFYSLWHNSIIQASLSIFWTLIALILLVFANKKNIRILWFVGASLLGVVVIKLVFIDSVKLDGLIRAFAFIGVALLMLIIGYLAPLPPKNREQKK